MTSGHEITDKKWEYFLENLKDHHGVVTLACKDSQIHPCTFWKKYKRDQEFADKTDEIRDGMIGTRAEDNLFEAIDKGDLGASKFYLASRNQKYQGKMKVEGPVLPIGLEFVNLTDDEEKNQHAARSKKD